MNAGSTSPNGSNSVGRVLLRGRIAGVRAITTRDGAQLFLTLVNLPAPDEFTRPAMVEIQSKRRIGKNGDDFAGACQIGGYPNNYDAKDRETGEIELVRSARMNLTLIDG